MVKTKKKILVDDRYAKTGRYRKDLKEASEAKECPLCTLRWHTNPILKRKGGWFITRTTQPYKNTKWHFLLIAKKHVEDIELLKENDLSEVLSLIKWAKKEFNIKGGGVTLRFGETLFTGATIFHLHFHFIAPLLNKKKTGAMVVQFPIG